MIGQEPVILCQQNIEEGPELRCITMKQHLLHRDLERVVMPALLFGEQPYPDIGPSPEQRPTQWRA